MDYAKLLKANELTKRMAEIKIVVNSLSSDSKYPMRFTQSMSGVPDISIQEGYKNEIGPFIDMLLANTKQGLLTIYRGELKRLEDEFNAL